MHAYEPPRAPHGHFSHSHIPGMRVPQETAAPSRADSETPLYDALYAEYRRLFRAVPGDRADEEELRFEGFGTVRGTGYGHWGNSAGSRPRHGAAGPGQPPGAARAALPPGQSSRNDPYTTYEGDGIGL